MSLRIILAGLFLSVCLSACQRGSAYSYSETIVNKERSLTPLVVETETKAEKFMTSENYDSLVVVSKKMEDAVQQRIDEIRKLPAPDVKEGENFKAASLRYFEYFKSIYTSYKAYGQASEQDRSAARENMIALVDKKQKAIDDMQAAQKKFADANGFRLATK